MIYPVAVHGSCRFNTARLYAKTLARNAHYSFASFAQNTVISMLNVISDIFLFLIACNVFRQLHSNRFR